MRSAPSDVSTGHQAPGVGRRAARRAIAPGSLLLLALLALSAPPDRARAGAADADASWPAGAAALETSHAPVEGNWVVLTSDGEVLWRPLGDAVWEALAVGQVIPAQSEVGTGPDGALTLVVGGDRLVMGANSHLILPARGPGEDQRLRHDYGRLRIDVEPRSGRRVEIRTPLLSLGIKGTSFELMVDRRHNSILVLDGVVAVTPPDGRDAIDLGARQGWRQPVEPGAEPSRLEMAESPAPLDRVGPVRWHLPETDPAGASGTGWSIGPVGAAQAQSPSPAAERAAAVLGEPVRAPRHAGRSSGWLAAWLDHQTSLLTILLVAGGGLVILAVPALMLGQSLRAQWQNRPAGKGRRRRSLTHG